MAPICGLCNEEMGDIDFHLEGKCQRKDIEDYGTEQCAHRCHGGPGASDCVCLQYPTNYHFHNGGKTVTGGPHSVRNDKPETPSPIEIAAIISQDAERNGPISRAIVKIVSDAIERNAIRLYRR